MATAHEFVSFQLSLSTQVNPSGGSEFSWLLIWTSVKANTVHQHTDNRQAPIPNRQKSLHWQRCCACNLAKCCNQVSWKQNKRPALGGRGEGWKHNCIANSKGREAVEHDYIMYIYTWTPPYSAVSNAQAVCYEYVSRVVKTVVGNSCGSVCQDFGSLLHLDMFNSHLCAKSEILFNYINKVPCFAFWASSTHSQKIYI